MFTGIVEEVGVVAEAHERGNGRELTVRATRATKGLAVGDSIAVDGCCQTIVGIRRGAFSVVAVQETLRKTTLGNYFEGTRVNLERPMRADGQFGGHFVLGHVDCTTRVTAVDGEDTSRMFWFSLPQKLAHLVIPVGSIAVNGVSLTVARIRRGAFGVAIIPHTSEHTTFRDLAVGDRVNIEFDVLGKYVERVMAIRRRPS